MNARESQEVLGPGWALVRAVSEGEDCVEKGLGCLGIRWSVLQEGRGGSGDGVEGDWGEHPWVGLPGPDERKGQGEEIDEIPVS